MFDRKIPGFTKQIKSVFFCLDLSEKISLARTLLLTLGFDEMNACHIQDKNGISFYNLQFAKHNGCLHFWRRKH